MNDSGFPPAEQVVATTRGTQLKVYGGYHVIIDLRHLEDEFLSAVNDIQLGVIRNRLADNSMNFISSLPLAAKTFVKDQIFEHASSKVSAQMKNLDVSVHRLMLHHPGRLDLNIGRKRLNSGVFVILPYFHEVIEVERINFGPDGPAMEYWVEVELAAELLGPLPI